MSRDSQGNPSQPHCVSVSWLIFRCIQSSCLCRKNLGIASAGAAGLGGTLKVPFSGKECAFNLFSLLRSTLPNDQETFQVTSSV